MVNTNLNDFKGMLVSATKYSLRPIFKEKELASSPSILQKANILRY